MRLSSLLVAWLSLAYGSALDRRWWNGNHWVTIWGRSPQTLTTSSLPPAPYNGTSAGFLNGTTVRQTIPVTLGADIWRLRISNAFSAYPLHLTSMTVALPTPNATGSTLGQPGIQTDTLQTVKFSGSSSYTVPPSALVVSDPINFTLPANGVVSISLYLENGQEGANVTGHLDTATISWFTNAGDQTAAANFSDPSSVGLRLWPYIEGIEGWLDSGSRSMVAVGDSITDGAFNTIDASTRWLDDLFFRMQNDTSTTNIGIVNKGISANTILNNRAGIGALGRVETDVLAQPGTAYGLIFEGTNDIGVASNDSDVQYDLANQLIEGFEQFITRLHAFSIPVIGCTITPFQPPPTDPVQIGYYSDTHERTRNQVNDWIRNSGWFDAVVDFDLAIRNESNPSQIQLGLASQDFLHPNNQGYVVMADAFDLSVFDRLQGGWTGM